MLPNRIIVPLFLGLVAYCWQTSGNFASKTRTPRTAELMAEFNQWKSLSMTKQSNGMWTTIKVSIPPGTYGYKFLVDEKDWVFDPNNPGRKAVDGVENSSIRRSVVEGGAPATP